MEAPAAATITPPIAGPVTNVSEKPTLRAALPSRSASSAAASSPSGASSALATRATSARSRALAASAAVPSTAARTRIGASAKCHPIRTASAAVTTASTR